MAQEILEQEEPTLTLGATIRAHGMPIGVSYPCEVTKLDTNDKSGSRYKAVDMRKDVSYGDMEVIEQNGKPVYQRIGIWTTQRADGHRLIKEYGENGKYCKEPLTHSDYFDDYRVLSRREWDAKGNFVRGWSYEEGVKQRIDSLGNTIDVKQTRWNTLNGDGSVILAELYEETDYPWVDDQSALFDVHETAYATYNGNGDELTRNTRFIRKKRESKFIP